MDGKPYLEGLKTLPTELISSSQMLLLSDWEAHFLHIWTKIIPVKSFSQTKMKGHSSNCPFLELIWPLDAIPSSEGNSCWNGDLCLLAEGWSERWRGPRGCDSVTQSDPSLSKVSRRLLEVSLVFPAGSQPAPEPAGKHSAPKRLWLLNSLHLLSSSPFISSVWICLCGTFLHA